MKRQLSSPVDASVDAFASESVNLDVAAIGARIKAARKAIRLTQDSLAARAGATSNRGLQDNEAGKSMPGGQMIGTLVCAGINANWLLTGEGPMLLADLQPAVPAGMLDPERLQASIQAVDEGLANADRVMKPEKKAELVLAVYDLLQEPSVTKERVLRLIKLAA